MPWNNSEDKILYFVKTMIFMTIQVFAMHWNEKQKEKRKKIKKARKMQPSKVHKVNSIVT